MKNVDLEPTFGMDTGTNHLKTCLFKHIDVGLLSVMSGLFLKPNQFYFNIMTKVWKQLV